jgi:predicted transglutaminase-like cysteine proteinase
MSSSNKKSGSAQVPYPAFGDVKMFARVAAFSIAALIVVLPPPPYGGIGVLADADASVAVNLPAAAPNEDKIFKASLSGANLLNTSVQGGGTSPANLPGDDTTTQPKLAAFDRQDPPVTRPAPAEPFSLDTMPWFSGDIFEKWNSIKTAIEAEHDILTHCRQDMQDCPAAQKFLTVIAAGLTQTGRARVGVINRAINLAIEHMSDLEQWGVDERWSPPLETFATGRGDCEDYAIAKFVALVEAGISPEDVRLVIVRDQTANDGHAITAVHVDDGWVLLDNRWLALVDDDKMRRMVPLFVIDHDGVRTYLRSPASPAALASASLAIPLAN